MANLKGLKHRLELLKQIFTERYECLPIPLKQYTLFGMEVIRKEAPVANANIFGLFYPDSALNLGHLKNLTRDESGRRASSSEFDAAQLIYNLVLLKKPEAIIEVGTYIGAVSCYLASAQKEYLTQSNIHLIDINQKYLDITKKNLEKFNLADNVVFHCGDSVDIAKSGKIPISQLIYIDADHSFQGIKRDVNAYWPLLKKGGLLVLHDSVLWEGVRRVANFFIGSKNLICTLATSGGSGISIIKKNSAEPYEYKKI